MAMDLPYTFDGLPQESDEATGDRAGLRSGISARAVVRVVLLSLLFFMGFAWGVIAGAEGERATTEIQQTLW